jgi:eukaryotic-like serine/threonine-protein kinase
MRADGEGPLNGRRSSSTAAARVDDHWCDVTRLFAEALEVPVNRRDDFLDASAKDDRVREEVRVLLAAHDSLLAEGGDDQRFLERLDAARALTFMDVGRTVGPYRIMRELGRGGMGAVYLAEREDQFRKRVAIKVLPPGMGTRESVWRFLEERQILASLDHRGIARLLDGGVTEDGLPYYVMEYVEGTPIDAFCDAQRLTIDERLRLFCEVCEAVQYAHRNLVVHRDLKPGNILVTAADGQIKLLDFGIAKLLGPGRIADITLTGPGARPMTPEYASPEQVLGRPISTASDVYSLGVLLYRLLTGRHPYPVAGRARHEAEQAIVMAPAERPSASVRRFAAEGDPTSLSLTDIATTRRSTPDRLRRRLEGDLDNIMLRALRKEPERRYTTVEQFAADVARHLAGLPVHARPDTGLYRAQKFVGRHRVGAAAVTAFAFLAIGFNVTTQLQSARIRSQSRRIAEERDKAEQVVQFLTELFAVSDPGVSRGQSVAARELLDRGAQRIDRELASQPEARAQMMDAMGRAYFGLGLYDPAKRLLENALALRRRVYGSEHPEVVSTLFQLAYLHRIEGRFALAEPLYRESLATQRRLYDDDHPEVIGALNGLAFLLRGRGDFAPAESVYREALERGRRTFDRPHVTFGHTLNGLGSSICSRGNHAAAEPFFHEALSVYRTIHGDDHPDVDIVLYNLAVSLHEQGSLDSAESVYRDVLERSRSSLGGDHPLFATGIYGLADVLHDQGRHRDAEALFRQTLAIQRRTLPRGSDRIANTLVGLGGVLVDLGRPAEGEPLLREALATREANAPGHWRTSEARSELGAALSALGQFTEAESLLARGYRGLRKLPGINARQTVRSSRLLRAHYQRVGRAAAIP